MPPKQAAAATIAEQLRAIIHKHINADTLTPYSLAEGCGLDPSTISRFLAGTRGLTTDTMDKVCAYLGVYLAEGRMPETSKPTRREVLARERRRATKANEAE